MAASMNKSISDAPNKDEETYQLLEQLDHILKRPETYIGSNKPSHEVRGTRNEPIAPESLPRKCGLWTIKVRKILES